MNLFYIKVYDSLNKEFISQKRNHLINKPITTEINSNLETFFKILIFN